MTVAAFYEATAHEGRAVLEGTPTHPQRWLVKAVSVRGAEAYFHCYAHSTRMRQLHAQASAPVAGQRVTMRFLKATYRTRQWKRGWVA